MQTVAIHFTDPELLGEPFDDPDYRGSYQKFSAFCAERDMAVVFTRGDSYLGNMRFSSYSTFEGEEIRSHKEAITVNLIYRKSFELTNTPGDVVICSPKLEAISHNKWLTYELFTELMASTCKIDTNNWREVLEHIQTDKVVLKPVSGNGGQGIQVEETATLDFPSLNLSGEYLAQEFVDSSSGIPGIVDGIHDLRIILYNSTPTLSFVRSPAHGSLLANVALGGSARTINLDSLPQSALDLVAKVDQTYAQYGPRHYAVDMFFSDDTPYLIETNTMPGFPVAHLEGQAFQTTFFTRLYELFIETIEKQGTE